MLVCQKAIDMGKHLSISYYETLFARSTQEVTVRDILNVANDFTKEGPLSLLNAGDVAQAINLLRNYFSKNNAEAVFLNQSINQSGTELEKILKLMYLLKDSAKRRHLPATMKHNIKCALKSFEEAAIKAGYADVVAVVRMNHACKKYLFQLTHTAVMGNETLQKIQVIKQLKKTLAQSQSSAERIRNFNSILRDKKNRDILSTHQDHGLANFLTNTDSNKVRLGLGQYIVNLFGKDASQKLFDKSAQIIVAIENKNLKK